MHYTYTWENEKERGGEERRNKQERQPKKDHVITTTSSSKVKVEQHNNKRCFYIYVPNIVHFGRKNKIVKQKSKAAAERASSTKEIR